MKVTSSGVYTRPTPIPKMPAGLVELMEGLTKDVLKHSPPDIYEFCANHMQKLLEIRDGRTVRGTSITLENKIARAQKKVKERAEKRRLKYDNDIYRETPLSDSSITPGITYLIVEEPQKENDMQMSLIDATILPPVCNPLTSLSEIEISQSEVSSTDQHDNSQIDDEMKQENSSNVISDQTKFDSRSSRDNVELTKKLNENVNNEFKIEPQAYLSVIDNPELELTNTVIVDVDDQKENLVKDEQKNSNSFDVNRHDKDVIMIEDSFISNENEIDKNMSTSNNNEIQHTEIKQIDRIIDEQKDIVKEKTFPELDNTDNNIADDITLAVESKEVYHDDDSTSDTSNVNQINKEAENAILKSNETVKNNTDEIYNKDISNPNCPTIAGSQMTEKNSIGNEDVSSIDHKHMSTDNDCILRKLDPETDSNIPEYNLRKFDNESKLTKEPSRNDNNLNDREVTLLCDTEVVNEDKELVSNKHNITKRDTHSNVSLDNLNSIVNMSVDISDENTGMNTEEDNSTNITKHNAAHNNMDLETAAITIQKVFRSFLFRSRSNSTFDDTINDDRTLMDIDTQNKEENEFLSSKERIRHLGLTRADTVLQTVNEEKSLSVSTDDSSTMSSAATIIQAHVRGFLVRNRLNSKKTASSNSVVNSDGPSIISLDADTEEHKKTVLNIHIVPEEQFSNDESMATSIDLPLDNSPSSSTNLHPLGYDKSEPRKQLKREDAIQSISPPSNNSGKLSDDSIKDIPINESDEVAEKMMINEDSEVAKCKSQEINSPKTKTQTRHSKTLDGTFFEKDIEIKNLSNDQQEGNEKEPKKILTKISSDEMDVITPFEEKTILKSYNNHLGLLHSGEFHDTVLPTKVSRGDTTVVRGE